MSPRVRWPVRWPIIAGSLLAIACEKQSPQPVVTPLTKAWQRVIPFQEVPDGLEGIRAEDCGECHDTIYEEWRATTHAAAYGDLQFQAEWRKDGKLWLCVNCHTPLENQLERVVTGLVGGDYRKPVSAVNPHLDEALRDESITCAACHVRAGQVIGAGIGNDAPHPVRVDKDLLSQRLCEDCHNVHERLSESLICNFSTGDEWRTSLAFEEGTGCIDCHMPEVERPLVDGGPKRPGHRHTWFGAGIAKRHADIAPVREAYTSGYDVEVSAHADGGDEVAITLAITNARAGHELPTGDPERFITIRARLLAADGSQLWSHNERIGEVWQWYPEAKLVSDNSIKPGERRAYDYEIPLAGKSPRGLVVEYVVRNHRMTEANAKATKLDASYPLAVETRRERIMVAAVGAAKATP